MSLLTERGDASFRGALVRAYKDHRISIYRALTDSKIYLTKHPNLVDAQLGLVEHEFRRRCGEITPSLAYRFGGKACVMYTAASSIMEHCPVSTPEISNPEIDTYTVSKRINGYFAFTAAASNISLLLTTDMAGVIHDLCEFLAFSSKGARQEVHLAVLKFFCDAYVRKRLWGGFRLVAS